MRYRITTNGVRFKIQCRLEWVPFIWIDQPILGAYATKEDAQREVARLQELDRVYGGTWRALK